MLGVHGAERARCWACTIVGAYLRLLLEDFLEVFFCWPGLAGLELLFSSPGRPSLLLSFSLARLGLLPGAWDSAASCSCTAFSWGEGRAREDGVRFTGHVVILGGGAHMVIKRGDMLYGGGV